MKGIECVIMNLAPVYALPFQQGSGSEPFLMSRKTVKMYKCVSSRSSGFYFTRILPMNWSIP